jgi:hypothetical protein
MSITEESEAIAALLALLEKNEKRVDYLEKKMDIIEQKIAIRNG